MEEKDIKKDGKVNPEVKGHEVDEEKDLITITDIDPKCIRVEHEDGRFVEGRVIMTLGMKRFVKNLSNTRGIRVNEDREEYFIELNDYDDKKDKDIYIMHTLVERWSKKVSVSKETVMADDEVTDLLERFVEEVIERNKLDVDPRKKRKKKKS